ncbi:MAG: efflux RND transporter periplasmic adaptor subunit, partial [Patescibacteria group bacterium]
PVNFVNGLSGEAAIIIKSAKNVLTIPLEALRDDNTVFIQTENGLRPVKVTPGTSSDTDVEIKKGLKEKDRVLLNPPSVGVSFSQSRFPFSGIFGHIESGRSQH